MSPATAPATAVLDALVSNYGTPAALTEEHPLEQLVLLILNRGADGERAKQSMARLLAEYVDWNEVRVSSAHEIAGHLEGLPDPHAKAVEVKDLLITVYHRFNKLDLDFLKSTARSGEDARRKERFNAWLEEKSPALAAMMTAYVSDADQVVVTGGLPRVLNRLGWLGRSQGVGACRAALESKAGEDQRLAVQWGLYHVVESACQARSPECLECVLLEACPTGATAKKAAEKKAKEEAAEAAKKAKEEARAARKKASKKAPAAAAAPAPAPAKKTAKKAAKKTPAARKKVAKKKTAKKKAGSRTLRR